MARKHRVLFEGAIYHVTFRGNAKQDIFADVHDRHRMLERLAESCELHQVRIFQYCLMPNHVHLLVQTKLANLDRFMSSLLTGYCVYFNLRHQRSGHLMQGRYGAQLVSGDQYLLNLSRYIHLNPVKVEYWKDKSLDEKLAFLRQYAWSSYRQYIGFSAPEDWLNIHPIMQLLPKRTNSSPPHDYATFIESGLSLNDDSFRQLLESQAFAIGPEAFINEMHKRYEESLGDANQQPSSLRKASKSIPPEVVINHICRILGYHENIFPGKKLHGPEKAFLARALMKYAGLTQVEIAPYLFVSTGAAVSLVMKKHGSSDQAEQWMKKLDLSFKD